MELKDYQMKPKLFKTIFALLICAVTGVANASLISLNTSNVIGSTVSYDSRFLAENIFDNQSGVITELNQMPNDAEGGYWLNPNNGTSDAWITIDLGDSYVIDFVELFNTHNANYFDRGTGDFRILASNSVVQLNNNSGYDLAGIESVLVDSTLFAESGSQADPLTAQSFYVSDQNAFRYLQFNADSVAVGGNPCCGSNVFGLNEMRVSGVSAIPEPASIAFLALGLLGLSSRRMKK